LNIGKDCVAGATGVTGATYAAGSSSIMVVVASVVLVAVMVVATVAVVVVVVVVLGTADCSGTLETVLSPGGEFLGASNDMSQFGRDKGKLSMLP